jgi:hypothetical protein
MSLSLRPRQRHAVVELINLMKNSKTPLAAFTTDPEAEADEANTYKVLVLDKFTHDIIAPLVTLKDLRDHGVTLHLKLQQDREEIPDTPAVYFVAPTAENVKLIANDFKRSLYDSYHLNFTSTLPTSAFVISISDTSLWRITCSISQSRMGISCCTIRARRRRMSSA